MFAYINNTTFVFETITNAQGRLFGGQATADILAEAGVSSTASEWPGLEMPVVVELESGPVYAYIISYQVNPSSQCIVDMQAAPGTPNEFSSSPQVNKNARVQIHADTLRRINSLLPSVLDEERYLSTYYEDSYTLESVSVGKTYFFERTAGADIIIAALPSTTGAFTVFLGYTANLVFKIDDYLERIMFIGDAVTYNAAGYTDVDGSYPQITLQGLVTCTWDGLRLIVDVRKSFASFAPSGDPYP